MFRLNLSVRGAIAGLGCTLLLGCASAPPFDATGVQRALTPRQAIHTPETKRGSEVIWGGAVISGKNLEDSTQFEILGYPLGDDQRPDVEARPEGRFFALVEGYVETLDFSPGRLVTVKGRLIDVRSAKVGDADYVYPVLRAERIHLWPEGGTVSPTRVHFGFGVILSN